MKKGIKFLFVIILSSFIVLTLSGCEQILELFITEERTNSEVTTTVKKDNKTTKNVTNTSAQESKTTNGSITQGDQTTVSRSKQYSRNTTTTYIKKTSYDTTTKKQLVYTTTYSTCSHNEKRVDEVTYPSFSYYGNDGYVYCDKCGGVLSVDYTDPYGTLLQSDVDYEEYINGDTIRKSYSLFLNEKECQNNNNQKDSSISYNFTLVTLVDSSKDGYSISYDAGSLKIYDKNIYVLSYGNKSKEESYAIFNDGSFRFTTKEGKDLGIKTIAHESPKTAPVYVPRKGNSDYGYYFFENYENAVELQSLYYEFYKLADALYNSNVEVPFMLSNYLISVVDTRLYNLSYNEICAVWTTFYNESPLYFFLDNSITVYDKTIPCLLLSSEYYTSSKRKTVIDDINTMTDLFLKTTLESMSEQEIAKAAHDFVVNRIDYAWKDTKKTIPETEAWAHSIVGTASKGYGVCESYAKTYMYLTNLLDVDTIIVSGKAKGEGHAWNLTCIDGIWYGVDVTWDDQESGTIYKYFLTDNATINENRSVLDYTVLQMSYLYKLPEISEVALK